MTTKYDIGQKCWLFDAQKCELVEGEVIGIIITNDGRNLYRVGELVVPEPQLFGTKEDAKKFYREIFK